MTSKFSKTCIYKLAYVIALFYTFLLLLLGQVRIEAALTLRALAEVDPTCVGGLISYGVTMLNALRENISFEKVIHEVICVAECRLHLNIKFSTEHQWCFFPPSFHRNNFMENK